MNRRSFLSSAGAGLSATRTAGSASAAQPLNLLYIIADQHSGTAMPQAGDHIVKVPNLERLGRQGVTFTHAYTAGMSCSPSRASLDTGLHHQTHGVRSNGIPLRPDTPSIHRTLEQNGHLASTDPRGHGAYLKALGYDDVATGIIGSKRMARLVETPYRFETGTAGFAPGHQQDAYTTDHALRFLQDNQDKRFACWVRLHGSHDPFVAPPPFHTW